MSGRKLLPLSPAAAAAPPVAEVGTVALRLLPPWGWFVYSLYSVLFLFGRAVRCFSYEREERERERNTPTPPRTAFRAQPGWSRSSFFVTSFMLFCFTVKKNVYLNTPGKKRGKGERADRCPELASLSRHHRARRPEKRCPRRAASLRGEPESSRGPSLVS